MTCIHSEYTTVRWLRKVRRSKSLARSTRSIAQTRWRSCYSRSRMRSELQTLKTNDDKYSEYTMIRWSRKVRRNKSLARSTRSIAQNTMTQMLLRSRMRSELQTLKTNDDKVSSRPKSQNDRPCDESQNARHTLSMSNRCWTESVFTLQHPNTNNDGWEWLLTPPWCCGRGNVNAGVWLVATQSSAAEESESVGHFPYRIFDATGQLASCNKWHVGHFPYCGQIKLNWRQLWLIMSKHSWNFKFE